MAKNITFKKRKKAFPKQAIAAICVVVAAVLVAVGFIVVKNLWVNREKPEEIAGCTWSTEGFENISDIKSCNEVMAIFTDAKTGKKGIMSLDGKVTEAAEHNSFSVASDAWRNYRYLVDSPRSEYTLLADPETKTVTTRQYHGIKEPEQIPCWSTVAKHLAWTDAKGYAGEIKTNAFNLKKGFYPVATSLQSDAKWGYISEKLRLEIAAVYDNALDFSSGLAAVSKDGKWGYINESGVTKIPFEFDSVSGADLMGNDVAFSFINGLAPVSKNGKYGIINSKSETVIDFKFDIILQGENGKYIAKKDGVWGLITVDEKLLAAETTTAAKPTSAGEVIKQGNYIVKTAGSVLNMRASASAESDIVAKIPNGTVLTVTKSVSGWAYVTYSSAKGWVSSDFLVENTAVSTTAATTAAN